MEAYLLDWAGLVLRWAHLVAGIAWIGASFYFIWLDDSLEPPKRAEDRARGVAGELWAVHGGGFYRAEKYALAPPELPERLHWFKWEAYWTWITGFALLVLLYYANAETYLIDPQVMPLAKSQAIGLGLGSLVVGVAVYEGLCRSPLGRNDAALAAALLLFLAALAWALTQVFGGRGAFIHYGAVIGTIMAANVGHIIIPGQRELVRAMREGRPPDPKFAIAGKQRSVHNTYLTLPVLFTMISSHYATAFASRWNWLVLVALTVAGALVRVWFVMRHK
ncbi:MAG: urate hydroxylase PuuD, partial [Elioraea sp.]|nr:urate hydroxylase PuuD [Elioraea sp.]